LSQGEPIPLGVTCIFSIVVVVVIVVINSRFVRVNALLTPHLVTGFQGFKLSTRHQPFLQGLRAVPCGIPSRHCKALTLSFPGGPLGGHLAVAIHISPNNGPIEMIPSKKLVVDVLAIHCTL
jgi:hypothetical protein